MLMLEVDEDNLEEEVTTAMDAQQGHAAGVSSQHYAIKTDQLGHLNNSTLFKFYQASRLIQMNVYGLPVDPDNGNHSQGPGCRETFGTTATMTRDISSAVQLAFRQLLPTMNTFMAQAIDEKLPQLVDHLRDILKAQDYLTMGKHIGCGQLGTELSPGSDTGKSIVN
jgi:hypothetical protein